MEKTPISGGFNNVTGRFERRFADGSIQVRRYVATDDTGHEIGVYESRDAAAGACQDAAREADSDGEGYEVTERFVDVAEVRS